jgi:3-oxoadipate enol-lactonase
MTFHPRRACRWPSFILTCLFIHLASALLMADQSNILFVEVDGAKVAYKVDGQGSGLVLIPGTGGNADNSWGHLIEHFTPHWKVVRPEYSGAGHTTDTGGPLSIEMLAKQVIAAAEAADAVPFDLVGFSLGGCIAAYIAAEYPDKVRSVVILAGFSSAENKRSELQFSLWKDLIGNNLPAMAKLVLINGFSDRFIAQLSDSQIEGLLKIIETDNDWQGMLRQIDLDMTLDIREQIKRIQKPTLVIGCSYDQLVPVESVRELAQAIQGAQYAELPSGHLAIIEQPEQFVRLTQEFLNPAVSQ